MSRIRASLLRQAAPARLSAAAVLAAVLLGACGGGDEQAQTPDGGLPPAPEEANYTVAQTKQGEYIKLAEGSAQVYYPVSALVCWEGGSARFREILVKDGQEVKEGECLAVFDVEFSRAEQEEMALTLTRRREEADQGKEERREAVRKAQEELKTLEGYELDIARLRAGKLETEYEQYVYQSDRQIAQLEERARALAEAVSEDAVYAPFDGVVDDVASYNPGDPVAAGQAVVAMHGTDRFYFLVDDSAGSLRYNMEVELEVGKRGDRKTYKGRVVAASGILPASASRGIALIEPDGDIPEEELRGSPTYRYRAEELQGVLLADWKAVKSEKGKSYVYVLEGDMMQKRYVVPGLDNRKEAWILDGLSEGQTVIAD